MSRSKSKKIIVFDTTLRDGEQAPGFHMKPAKKLAMARQLARMNVDVIEAGFPYSSPMDAKAVSMISNTVGRQSGAPSICALARCVPGDINAARESVKAAKKPRVHIFIATSPMHIKKKLNMSEAEVLDRIRQSVVQAKKGGMHVQFSAEDASRSKLPFLAQAVRTAIRAGAKTINIPDTVGYAVPHEFHQRIASLIKMVPESRDVVMSVHCHDDLGMAVANTYEAIRAGARQVECAINGIGERAGNCATEEIVMAVHVRGAKEGFQTKVRTKEIHQTSQMLSHLVGVTVPLNKAIVGKNAFSHASGIHQDGIMKHRSTYEIMKPELIGLEGHQLVMTARSGRNAIKEKLNQLGFNIEDKLFERFYTRYKHKADLIGVMENSDMKQLAQWANR